MPCSPWLSPAPRELRSRHPSRHLLLQAPTDHLSCTLTLSLCKWPHRSTLVLQQAISPECVPGPDQDLTDVATCHLCVCLQTLTMTMMQSTRSWASQVGGWVCLWMCLDAAKGATSNVRFIAGCYVCFSHVMVPHVGVRPLLARLAYRLCWASCWQLS